MSKNLPLLEDIKKLFEPKHKQEFAETAFVFVQHILESNVALIETVIDLGASPNFVFVIGKFYSTNQLLAKRLQKELGANYFESSVPGKPGQFENTFRKDIDRLWREVGTRIQNLRIKRVIIVDDGGTAIQQVPQDILRGNRIIGIEQTTFGLRKNSEFPVIQVASSAAKKILESPLICDAVLNKLRLRWPSYSDFRQFRFGVVGLGNIGRNLVKRLQGQGCKVLAYDKKSNHLRYRSADSFEEIISLTDVIFGCTGKDLGLIPSSTHESKTFISCSSGDIEFRSMLLETSRIRSDIKPLRNIALTFPEYKFIILRGGYPINFDNSKESVPSHKIQLTMGLLLGAILQAFYLRSTASIQIMLDPMIQKYVAERWFEYYPDMKKEYDPHELDTFDDLMQLSDKSGGRLDPSVHIKKAVILIVDDEADFLETTKAVLEGYGYSVLTKQSPTDALKLLSSTQVDMIIADLTFPVIEGDGFSFFEKVQKVPHLRKVPFILMSGTHESSFVRTGVQLGVDDYLTKPVDADMLAAVVEGKLKKYRSLREND